MCLYYYLFGCAFLGNDKYILWDISAVLAHFESPKRNTLGGPQVFLTLYSTICL
jgi:hypothetical protein